MGVLDYPDPTYRPDRAPRLGVLGELSNFDARRNLRR